VACEVKSTSRYLFKFYQCFHRRGLIRHAALFYTKGPVTHLLFIYKKSMISMIGMISTLVHILHKFFINMHGPVTPRHCYNKHRDDYPLRY